MDTIHTKLLVFCLHLRYQRENSFLWVVLERKYPVKFILLNSKKFVLLEEIIILFEVCLYLRQLLLICMTERSSRPEAFCKNGVFRKFTKFTGKHLGLTLFFNKLQASLLTKRLWHGCFPANSAKFLRTPFLTEHLQ